MGAGGAGAGDDRRADLLRMIGDEIGEHDLVEVDRALLEESEREDLLSGIGVDRCRDRGGGDVGVAGSATVLLRRDRRTGRDLGQVD